MVTSNSKDELTLNNPNLNDSSLNDSSLNDSSLNDQVANQNHSSTAAVSYHYIAPHPIISVQSGVDNVANTIARSASVNEITSMYSCVYTVTCIMRCLADEVAEAVSIPDTTVVDATVETDANINNVEDQKIVQDSDNNSNYHDFDLTSEVATSYANVDTTLNNTEVSNTHKPNDHTSDLLNLKETSPNNVDSYHKQPSDTIAKNLPPFSTPSEVKSSQNSIANLENVLATDKMPKSEDQKREAKESKLESYKQFLAEQKSQVAIDYPSIRISIEANALPSRMYFIMNALSAIIASYGLIMNSAAVVIGAMLVAMMLGPISGVALAIIDYRRPFLRKSLLTVLAGGSIVVGIGFIIGFIHEGQPLTNEILSRTQPTSMDLMVALAGGTAGAYAMISPQLSVAVVGVAVATALVPPLAASGILFANGELTLGFGALILAVTNIIAIQFTNALVLWFAGFRRLIEDDYKSNTYLAFFKRNAVPLLLLTGIGIYLTINLDRIATQQHFENVAAETISNYFIDKGNVLTATQFLKQDGHQLIRAVIHGETRPSSYDVKSLENHIYTRMHETPNDLLPIQLQLRYVPIVVIESEPRIDNDFNKTDAVLLSTDK